MTGVETDALIVPKVQTRKKLVPPDGGWGWMVLLGTGMSNVSKIFLYCILCVHCTVIILSSILKENSLNTKTFTLQELS